MKTSTPDTDPDRMRTGLRALESMARTTRDQLGRDLAADPAMMILPHAFRSFVARVETIAHLSLLREPVGHAVNLDQPLVDLGIIRNALRVYRLEVEPGEEKHVDRLIAALDGAQAMLAGEEPAEVASDADAVSVALGASPNNPGRAVKDATVDESEDFG